MTKLFTGTLIGVALLVAMAGSGAAQSLLTGAQRWGYQVFETTLVVDARPLAAEILLNGRPLGPAQSLIAQAISVGPGTHTLEVRAPGYYPYFSTFTPDTHSS